MRKLVAVATMALGIATLPMTAAHAGSTWIVTVKASATTVNVGQKVTFTGTVKPRGAAAGQKVVLQERFKPGAKWRVQATDRINAKGRYSLSDKPTANTRHSYRVVMPATGKHRKGVSATSKVTVYDWTYLTKLTDVNNQRMTNGAVNINAKAYRHSVFAYSSSSASREYNVDHKCIKMRATFGISDNSSTGGQATVGVISDGTNVYSNTFDVGQREKKTVEIAKPLKLRLEAVSTGAADTQGHGAFGSAQVLCTS
jgi:hypothetical protein